MNKYTFKVTHDHGMMTITVPARSEYAAKEKILKMELCPESALELVKIVQQGREKSIYYSEQLDQINFNGEYAATVQFKDVHGRKTHYMDVNINSARAIIDHLKEKFDL